MSSLYSNLSSVYETMYQSFINYEEEFSFYYNILLKYGCKSVLEIGCGSGHLAKQFVNTNFQYVGIDLSEDMLTLARKNNAASTFVQADMRNFILATKTDAAIITGRTISYLVTNMDLINCFNAIYKNIHEDAVLCFDCIDANKFIPQIDSTKKIIHEANFNDSIYKRESNWKINTETGFCFEWASSFFKESNEQELESIGEDFSTIRTFTKDEIKLFLNLTGFSVIEIIDRSSYSFDTFVIVATKIK